MSALTWLVDLWPPAIVLQAAEALLVAAILGLFQRRYASPALAPWTLAWLGEFASLAGLGAMEVLSARLPPTSAPMTGLAGLTLFAGYLKLGWLLLGTWALVDPHPLPRVMARAVLGGSAFLAVATALPAATDPDGQLVRYVARAGTLGVICGTARILAGAGLLRHTLRGALAGPTVRVRERPELGRILVAVSLVAIGVLALVAFTLTLQSLLVIAPGARPELAPNVPTAGGAHMLLQEALALGLVIWLLEGEQRRAEHRAYHDALTGLPNRQLLTDRLRHQIASARRAHQAFAVLFIDVDHFKNVNDLLGHAAGDRLLQAVAGRLTTALREADTVARLGGDEFIVLATGLSHPSDAAAVADKLRDAMHDPISLDGRDVTVTLSIGAALYPDDATDAEGLMRTSDAALYRAKEEGRDTVRLAGTAGATGD